MKMLKNRNYTKDEKNETGSPIFNSPSLDRTRPLKIQLYTTSPVASASHVKVTVAPSRTVWEASSLLKVGFSSTSTWILVDLASPTPLPALHSYSPASLIWREGIRG